MILKKKQRTFPISKKRNRTILLKLGIALFMQFSILSSYSQKSPSDWHLKKYSNGIAVYTRNASTSAYKELKSEVKIKTSLSSVVALILDYESYPQWVYRCGNSATLKKISETECIHYQTVIAPWPVDSRDFVVNVKLQQDAKTKIVIITSTCKSDFIPKIPTFVRITEFKATWTLIPLEDGTVEVVYQLLVNPGGYVPAWMVNLAVVDGPYTTTLNLKDWVLKPKYQQTKFSFVRELN